MSKDDRSRPDTTREIGSRVFGDWSLKFSLIKWFLIIIFFLFLSSFIPVYGGCQYNHYFPGGFVSWLNPFDDSSSNLSNINFNASFAGVLEQNCLDHNLTFISGNLSPSGFCVFPDGSSCDAHRYYLGECSRENNCSTGQYFNLNYVAGLLLGKNDELNVLIKQPEKDYGDWIKIVLSGVGQALAYIILILFCFDVVRKFMPYSSVWIAWVISFIVIIPFVYYVLGLDGVINLIFYLT